MSHNNLQNTEFTGGTYFQQLIRWFLESMDRFGVVVIISAGNGGYSSNTGKPRYYQAERTPANLVTDDSPYISVGATYHDGSVAEFTTPAAIRPGEPGHDTNPDDLSISMWAQGVDIFTCKPHSPDSMAHRSGTSFSAPIVVSLLLLESLFQALPTQTLSITTSENLRMQQDC
jgi:hypothetical protein